MTDNQETLITSHEVREITVTAALSLADQWHRKKRYAESITFNVEKITLIASSATGDLTWSLSGHRVLKDGRVTDRVHDRLWNSEPTDAPEAVLETMKQIVSGWRVVSS